MNDTIGVSAWDKLPASFWLAMAGLIYITVVYAR